MRMTVGHSLVLGLLLIASMTGGVSAETSTPDDPRGQWWTAWSDCAITPVQEGPAPEFSSSKPDALPWLQAETTNDSEIDLIVWLWTGNRPLSLDGVYAAEGMSTKWLWAFSERVTNISIVVENESRSTGEVQFGAPLTAFDYQWPSFVVVAEPGCWTFSITAIAVHDSIYEGRVVFPAVP